MTEQSGLTLRWPDGSLSESQLDAIIGRRGPVRTRRGDRSRAPRCGSSPTDTATSGSFSVSAADQFGEQPYLVFPGRTLSYASMVPTVAERGPPTPGPLRRGQG